MSGFLLDTNVVSELVRPRPDANVAGWVDKTDQDLLYLSVLTLGEIRKGIASVADASRRAVLDSWFNADLLSRFHGRIVPIDAAVADRWGRITAEAISRRHPISVIDGLLAATAMHYNFTLVTRNTRNLSAVAVPVLNPWSS